MEADGRMNDQGSMGNESRISGICVGRMDSNGVSPTEIGFYSGFQRLRYSLSGNVDLHVSKGVGEGEKLFDVSKAARRNVSSRNNTHDSNRYAKVSDQNNEGTSVMQGTGTRRRRQVYRLPLWE